MNYSNCRAAADEERLGAAILYTAAVILFPAIGLYLLGYFAVRGCRRLLSRRRHDDRPVVGRAA